MLKNCTYGEFMLDIDGLNYRPQRKVMFSQVSVCSHGEGSPLWRETPRTDITPSWTETPSEGTWDKTGSDIIHPPGTGTDM